MSNLSPRMSRRRFAEGLAVAAGGLGVGAGTRPSPVAAAEAPAASSPSAAAKPRRFELGTVTYNFGRAMDLDTLITTCEKTGFKAVELRSTHKHGVEPDITKEQRAAVRQRFTRTKVKLFGLGSACEFHSPDAEVVKQNIALAERFVELAADVGAVGVKVRPNGLPKQGPTEPTVKQIGHALQEVGDAGQKHGIEIWVEVHGPGTADPSVMRAIMDACGHPNVGVTWNSNPQDVKDGSIRQNFDLLKALIRCVHIHDLYDSYPYRELFTLLRDIGYDRYTEAEAPETTDPLRVMRYYRAMWELQSSPA
jgi:sugar phosphate isomerase/epimerase